MHLYVLPFAKIKILTDNIAEVVIDEGIEMDMVMVDYYHEFLLSHLHPPFSLLINNINSYSYNFKAQNKINTLKEINLIAVVAYDRITMITTELLATYPRPEPWSLKIFSCRGEALAWLLVEKHA